MRTILSLQEFRTDALPVRPEIRSQCLDRHPIATGRAAVPLHSLKGLEQVAALQHPL